MAEATLLLFHVAPAAALTWVRQRRRQGSSSPQELPLHAVAQPSENAAVKKLGSSGKSSSDIDLDKASDAGGTTAGMLDAAAGSSLATGAAAQAAAGASAGSEADQHASQQQAGDQQVLSLTEQEEHSKPGLDRLAAQESTLRAPVPLLRGLSSRFEGWEQRRPLLHRRLALAAITFSFMGVCSLQILAPGFVDVSIGELDGVLRAARWLCST